tara:strand:- start:2273 stop:3208 length:936 start_codon:yes stop_codon:yes gene_type:complete
LRRNDVPFIKDQFIQLQKSGLETSLFRLSGNSIIKKIRIIIQLRDYIKKENFDIVHCHWGYNTLFLYNINIPIVTTFHGSDLQGIDNKNFSIKLKSNILIFLSRLACYISVHNIFVSNKLMKASPKKIENITNTVIPMGFDTRLFKPISKSFSRKRLGINEKKIIILFAGNFKKSIKGYTLAIEVMKLMDDNFQLIKVNYNDHTDIPYFINASDVLLMTSFKEGAPVMIKEALACNTPIVSTDVGDVKEAIKGIPGCYVSKNRNPQILAELIKKSVNIGCHGIGFDKMKKYNSKRMTKKVIGVYKRVLFGG